MSILIDENTRLLIQGITGTEGSRACKEALRVGTHVVAGVTPGKGGEHVEGVPVFGTVTEAVEKYPDINATLILVPSRFAEAAALEAIAAGIPLITIVTENIPVQQCARIIAAAKQKGVRVVGPSSIGIVSPGKAKIGSIGMSGADVFSRGGVGVISKSGGMTSEIANALSRKGIGQSTVLGIGGDMLIGSSFADLLALFEADSETKAIVLFGEIGGTYEEDAAAFIQSGGCSKPVIALIAGAFTEALPVETALGHAGAIVSRGKGSYASKIQFLTEAGVYLARSVEEIPQLIEQHVQL